MTDLAVQLAETVEHIHARRVVHRDLKPVTILLGAYGPFSDFGIAHELGSTGITGTGFVSGTAVYSALEQIVGKARGSPPTSPRSAHAAGVPDAGARVPGAMAEAAMASRRGARTLTCTLGRRTAREPAQRPPQQRKPCRCFVGPPQWLRLLDHRVRLPGLDCARGSRSVAWWRRQRRLSSRRCSRTGRGRPCPGGTPAAQPPTAPATASSTATTAAVRTPLTRRVQIRSPCRVRGSRHHPRQQDRSGGR